MRILIYTVSLRTYRKDSIVWKRVIMVLSNNDIQQDVEILHYQAHQRMKSVGTTAHSRECRLMSTSMQCLLEIFGKLESAPFLGAEQESTHVFY